MNFFSYLHFFNFIVYVYLAAYIFIKNPKALINRICVGLFLCFAVWSFSNTFVHNTYTGKNIAIIFDRISGLGWASFSPLFLWFVLAFTGKKKILKKKLVYVIFFGIPPVFIYLHWTNVLYPALVKEFYGWGTQASQSIWVYLLYLYYLLFMGIALFITARFMRCTQNPIQKKQAKIIFITTLVALVLGSFTDMVFQLMNIHSVPDIADSFVLVLAFGVAYAMARYKFLTITPAAAADNIISTMHDCLILLNLEGNIVTVNKAALKTLGYKKDQLDHAPVSTLFTAAEINRGIIEEITSEGDFKDKESNFKTSKGKVIPVLFSKSILRDNTDSAGGIVCAAKDISERKKLEEEILKTKKLESIGILAGGIAHDFNNLLSVILGNVSLAQLEVSPQDKIYKFLSDLEKAALKAGELTGKFISFSRGGWLIREKITLSDILKNAMESEPRLKNKNTVYDINIPGDLLPIHGDKRQLGQVMLNLLLNAIEAMPGEKGGRITVSAENTTITSENQFQLKPGKYMKVSIEDNGTGIPAEIIDKVFDPYFSTKEKDARKGMGLGLTLCYSIIKKHDGHIAVESEIGKGTAVTLYLPVFTG